MQLRTLNRHAPETVKADVKSEDREWDTKSRSMRLAMHKYKFESMR
jgi:hypothetical protein